MRGRNDTRLRATRLLHGCLTNPRTLKTRFFSGLTTLIRRAQGGQPAAGLGRASSRVTMRTYAFLWPGDDNRTRSIIDAILSPQGLCKD